MNRNVLALAFLPILLMAGAVLAAYTGRSQRIDPADRAVQSGYKVATNTGEYRSDLSAADGVLLTHASTSIAAIPTFTCAGFPSITVSGKHSVASATVVVHVYRCIYDATDGLVVKTKSKGTLTAEATLTDGSTSADFMSTNSLGFDTEGFPIIKVVIEAPSSGNVDLIVEAY